MWTSFCWDLALASNSCIVFHAGWIPTFCGALRLRLRADRTLSHALVVLYTVCWTTISMDPNLSSNLVDHIFAVKVHVDNLSPGRSCLICLLVVSISYFHMTHDIYTVHTCIYIYLCYLFLLKAQTWTNKMAYTLNDSLHSCSCHRDRLHGHGAVGGAAFHCCFGWFCIYTPPSKFQQMPQSYEMPTPMCAYKKYML